MKTKNFSFNLPEELIAQYPAESRNLSRLLKLDKSTGQTTHHTVADLPALIDSNTFVVFNNSKVRKVRLFGEVIQTGGKIEFFLLKTDNDTAEAMVTKAKRQKPGREYRFPGGLTGKIEKDLPENRKLVRFSKVIDDSYLDQYGHVPLPPYIKREDQLEDTKRYQTVFARKTGSMAAPTAGLHFTDEILEDLHKKGVETAFVTLHVGLGTFLPVRTEELEDHNMHSEDYEIDSNTAKKINDAIRQGKKILAVGTTSIRTLESAWDPKKKEIRSGKNSTNIFIYPGYKFKVVNSIFTNFHTPESSLLMLVSAFAGKENIEKAYQTAINEKYRFFSYGDAMLII